MATALRKSKSFQKNLFFSIGGIFLLFAVCFSVYQYQREKEYKIDILHSRLQMYNYELMQSLGEQGILCDSLFESYTQSLSIDKMRVTIIDTNGLVLQDNNYQGIDSLPNHLKRSEVQEALAHGNGYDIKRTSESTHETYFYSATRFGDLVVRSAVPYSAELTESLKADNTFVLTFNVSVQASVADVSQAAMDQNMQMQGEGTYTQNGSNLALTLTHGTITANGQTSETTQSSTTNATFNGNEIVFENNGVQMVFTR